MYGSSFLLDLFFTYLACCVCGPGIGLSFPLSYSQGLSYIFFCCGKGGRGLRFFLSLFQLTFPRYFDYFLVIYGRGWWSNRRFGFVLFCVLCVYESSILVVFLFFPSKRFAVRLKYYFWKHSPIWHFPGITGSLYACIIQPYFLSYTTRFTLSALLFAFAVLSLFITGSLMSLRLAISGSTPIAAVPCVVRSESRAGLKGGS